MTWTPCMTCGEPSEATYCPEHTRHSWKPSAAARGYDWRWLQLSRRARRLQPFCSDCGATDDLTADHSPEAWRRKEAGLVIRLKDVDGAQMAMVQVAKDLAARGDIMLAGQGADDELIY